MEKVAVKKLRPGAVMPKFGSKEAAGADLYACLEESVIIAPGQTVFIPTGLAMALPRGYVGLVYARSGLACKQDLAPANKVGVIDSDYLLCINAVPGWFRWSPGFRPWFSGPRRPGAACPGGRCHCL